MRRQSITLGLILAGFYFKEFTRSLLLPNLLVLSHLFFGEGSFEAVEIGLLITALMGASAIACLLFGILADRRDRKSIILISLCIWVSGLAIIIFTFNYYILLIGQVLLGFGSGGYTPVAQAIIGDATPTHKKGQTYGLSSMLMALGFFTGILIASISSPFWQLPFYIAIIPLAILGLAYAFRGISFQIGFHEEELKETFKKQEEFSYNYRLTWDSFKGLVLNNKTNLLIFIEGVFSVLGFSMIQIYFFPYLQEDPSHITPLVTSLIMVVFIIPVNLIGILFWGRVGDHFVKRYPRIRVLLINLSFLVTTPLFIFIFWIKGSPATETTTLWAALTNPGILLFIIMFAVGMFLFVIYDGNQPSIINAINLPETRGSVFALNRFVEEIGAALGPLIIGIIFESAGKNYSIAMTLGMLLMIPGTICWLLALKTYPKDRSMVQTVLEARGRTGKSDTT